MFYAGVVGKPTVEIRAEIWRLLDALRDERAFAGVKPSAAAVVASLIEAEAARDRREKGEHAD